MRECKNEEKGKKQRKTKGKGRRIASCEKKERGGERYATSHEKEKQFGCVLSRPLDGPRLTVSRRAVSRESNRRGKETNAETEKLQDNSP